MPRRSVIALWAASIVAAVWIARPASTPPRPAPAPAATRTAVRETRVVTPPSGAMSIDEVRRAVREEIAAERVATPGDDQVEAPPEAIEAAHAVVQSAIATGRWTDATRDQLRRQVAALPRAELDPILSELFVALNAGTVRADVHGPLL